MLVLTRLVGERIVIGESIVIEVVAINNSQEPCEAELGIHLPDEVLLTLPEVE
jgi:sRNA-binding carbon storage regulator CsrA